MIKWMWHEPSNMMAVLDCGTGGLPLLSVCDERYDGMNPFYSYPFEFLKWYGWLEIGNIGPK